MGKSKLLVSIALKLQKKVSVGHHVVFILVRELIEEVMKAEQEINSQSVLSAFSYLVAANELGYMFVSNNRDTFKDILLDGFDELANVDLDAGYKCLSIIQGVFSESRIWVATRPHMLLELEKRLGVLGHNIREFDKIQQNTFLQKYWSEEEDTRGCRKRIEVFATACLSAVHEKISSVEQDFAGIPLQCRLIGEVYSVEAREYGASGEKINETGLAFEITSIEDLYKRLVRKKIEIYREQYVTANNLDAVQLMSMHKYYAMQSIFPKYKQSAPKHILPLNEMCKLGLIEATTSSDGYRFLHRTISEYFVSLSVAETLLSKTRDLKFTQFPLSLVFQTSPVELIINRAKVNTFQFKEGVICHFIDVLIGKSRKNLSEIFNSLSRNNRKVLSEACVLQNLENCLKLFYIPSTLPNTFWNKILAVSAFCADSSLMQTIIAGYKQNSKEPLTRAVVQKYTLLHIASISGNYGVVELLIGEGFKKPLTNSSFDNIIHECVTGTKSQHAAIIKDKIQIMAYMSKIDNKILSRINDKGNPPILSPNIHTDLVKYMFQYSLTDIEGNKLIVEFFHKSIKTYSSQEYYTLLRCIHEKKGLTATKELVNVWFNKSTLVDAIFKNIEPDAQLIQFLKDKCDWTLNSNSIHQTVVMHKKSADCFKLLLKHIKLTEDQLRKLLEYLLRYSKIDILAILLRHNGEHMTWANRWTRRNKDTLLHELIRKHDNPTYLPVIQKLIRKGADIKVKNKKGMTPLDELLMTKPSEYGLRVFDTLKSSNVYSPAKCIFMKLRWKTTKHYSIDENEIKLYWDLCEKQTDKMTMKDSSGFTLLQIAINAKNSSAEKLFRRR